MTLRDALLSCLKTLPGTRDFFIHVLISSPRKHSGLFPYAHPRPRVYLQDVLVLLSEQSSPDSPRLLVTAVEISVYNIPSSSCGILYVSKVDSTGQGISPSPTSTLVQGLLSYYANPATRPIAVDTLWIQLFARAQGQYLFPNSSEYPGKLPLSDVKLCAWWKRAFTDVAGRLESTWTEGEEKGNPRTNGTMKLYYLLPGYSELEAVHSLNISSSSTLRSKSSGNAAHWIYGHPYLQHDIPLPCVPASGSKGKFNLGHYVPSFDDDPKSRFLDELAHTLNGDKVRSPKRKRPKTTIHRKPSSKASTNGIKPLSSVTVSGPSVSSRDSTHTHSDHEEEEEEVQEGELNKVSPEEFWERMSFRQECVSGAITGFFALGICTRPSEPPLGGKPVSSASSSSTGIPCTPTPSGLSLSLASFAFSPLAPQPGQVAPRLVRRIVSSLMTGHEFSSRERAIRATLVLEESIKGLCENIAETPVTTNPNLSATTPAVLFRDSEPSNRLESQDSTISGISTSTFVDALEKTRVEEEEEGKAMDDGDDGLDVPRPRTPSPGARSTKTNQPPDVSINSFPEPEASLETYRSYIYGSISVTNPPLSVKDELSTGRNGEGGNGVNGSGGGSGLGAGKGDAGKTVRILAVRKKKRKVDV